MPLASVEDRQCHRCGATFTPKPGGYNARYCKKSCKTHAYRMQHKKPPATRAESIASYARIKACPVRLAKHRARATEKRRSVRLWLMTYKMVNGCIDCGFRMHFAALQLDHEGPKSDEIAVARSSIKRLKAEIENGQCKVRCANCHAIKTWERLQESKK